MILEEGVDPFKQFMREVIEDGRRSFKSRVRETARPRPLPLPRFTETTLRRQAAAARARPARPASCTRRSRLRIDDGRRVSSSTCDGSSAWGWHSCNCTPSAMQGALWVLFTQTLICNDKVNDGAYFATEPELPAGQLAEPRRRARLDRRRLGALFPSFTGFLRTLSRALQARGFIEEVAGALRRAGQRLPGRRHRPVRAASSAIMNFEIVGAGRGRSTSLDGLDYGAADVQPRGRHGRRRDVGAASSR